MLKLECEDCHLIEMAPEHETLFVHLYTCPEAMQFIAPVWTRAAAKKEFQQRAKLYAGRKGQWCNFAVIDKVDNEPVGIAGLKFESKRNNRYHFGHAYLEKARGKGLGTQVCQSLIQFGFEVLDAHKICAVCDVNHLASRRVLEKSGFQLEGVQKEQFYFNDKWCDDALYGLLKSVWAKTN